MSVFASHRDIQHLVELVGGGATEVIEAMNHLGWTVYSPSGHKIFAPPKEQEAER